MPKKKPSPSAGVQTTAAPVQPASGSSDEQRADVPEASFGKRLAELRVAKGLRHDSLSVVTRRVDPQKRGIARTTLRGYELGIYNPGIREIRILSQALDTTPDELVLGEGVGRPSAVGKDGADDPGAKRFRRDVVESWARFCFDMYHLDQPSRESIFRIAGDIARAKVGGAQYEMLLSAYTDVIETVIDGYLDQDPSAKVMLPDTILQLAPLVDALLSKHGFPEAAAVAARSLKEQAARPSDPPAPPGPPDTSK